MVVRFGPAKSSSPHAKSDENRTRRRSFANTTRTHAQQQKHTHARTHCEMADLDDIEDMIGEEELSRAAMGATTREPMVAPKNTIGGDGNGGAQSVSADTVASVPGTQLIW